MAAHTDVQNSGNVFENNLKHQVKRIVKTRQIFLSHDLTFALLAQVYYDKDF